MGRVQGRRETRAFEEEAALSVQELGGLPEGSRGREGKCLINLSFSDPFIRTTARRVING